LLDSSKTMENINLSFPIKRGITYPQRDMIWVNNFQDFDSCMIQYFGENQLDIYKQWGLDGHNGLDIACLEGEDIVATHDGKVIEVSDDETAGLGIVLFSPKMRFKTLYWHNKVNMVSLGETVSQGQIIAKADNTGYSTGTHLHFGLKRTNEHGTTINHDNGFKGAIDPLPYLKDMSVDEELLKLIYQATFKRDPDSSANGYLGKDIKTVLKLLLASEENEHYSDLYMSAKAIEKFGHKQS